MAFGELVKSLVVRFSSENWAAVKSQIDSFPDKKTVKIDADTSALGNLRAKIESALGGGGGGGFLSKLLGSAAVGPLSGLQGILSTPVVGPIALAGLVAAVAALANEITAVVSGFAAATAGAGAFALLAMPTFTAVSGALTALSTDTAAYDAATTKAAKSTALAKIKADWAALDPGQKAAVKSIQAFQSSFGKLATAFQPTVLKIFNDGLSILNHLLPVLTPMATAFAKALDPLLQKLDKFVQSKGFHDWLAKFTSLIGPATTAIGSGIGRLVSDVGKLLTTFSGKDVAQAINFFFNTIDGVIRLFTWLVNTARTAWDHWWLHVKEAGAGIAHAFGNVVHALDNVRHAFAVFGSDTARVFSTVGSTVARFFTSDIPHWISVGVSWFKRLPGMILSAIGNLGHLLFSAGASIIHGLISGIQSALGGLSGIMHSVAGIIGSFLPNSPEAKVGPLSGYGGLENRGRAISEFLARGIMAGSQGLTSAMAGATSGITRGIGAGTHGGGGGAAPVINITVHGFVGSELQLAQQIQKSLLALKRQRGFGQGNTSAGLGLA